VIRSIRQPEDRVARRGVRACALALAVAACAAAVPAGAAGAATGAYPPGPGAPGPGAPTPDPPAPHPDAPPVTTIPTETAPAPAAPQPADAPRPVAQRPTAGGGTPANDASLAIRRLDVTARVSLTAERPARLTVTFVPRPGSLVVGLVLVCLIATVGYVRVSHPNSSFPASIDKLVSHRDALRENPTFRCEPHKTYCSEMRSCAEAYFHQERCGGTEMDGDGDGIPCEQQWCR